MAEPIRATAQLVVSTEPDVAGIVIQMFLAGYKARTLEAYRTDMRIWRAWCDEHRVPLLEARRAHIELYANEALERGNKPSTVSRRLGTISGLYRYAYLEEILARDPAANVRRPKVPTESTTLGLDRMELSRFLSIASTIGPTHHALACLLGLNGLRVSEACSLDIENITIERGHNVISFVGKGDKPAVIPLAPATFRSVLALKNERTDGPLFVWIGRRMNRHDATRAVHKICRKAGLTKKISPHSLRHASITACLDAGVPLRDVQDFARHADPRTTSRYDRNRQSLDRNPTYTLAAFVGGG